MVSKTCCARFGFPFGGYGFTWGVPWLAWLLLANPAVRAQGAGASGNITGTVVDPSGAVIPKADIVAVDTARGTRYTASSDETGRYRLIGLLPASYSVTAQITGFATQTQTGVVVSVGVTVVADFHLGIAAAGQMRWSLQGDEKMLQEASQAMNLKQLFEVGSPPQFSMLSRIHSSAQTPKADAQSSMLPVSPYVRLAARIFSPLGIWVSSDWR